MSQPLNAAQSHQLEQFTKEFNKKNPKLVAGATVYGIHGPMRISGFAVDPSTRRLQIEAYAWPAGKPQKYDASYFAWATSLTNDPPSVVGAYVGVTKDGWDKPGAEPLMSPDDLTIAPHLRKYYADAMAEAELGAPIPDDDPKRERWGDSVDAWGYRKSPRKPIF